MLSVSEQRAWDGVQRSWADEAEAPPPARRTGTVGRAPGSRTIDDAPAPLVAVLWVAIFLVLFGVTVVGGVLLVVAMSSLLLWRYLPSLRPSDRRRTEPRTSDDRPEKTAPPARPTVAEVMCRRPATIDADTSLFTAWGRLHDTGADHVVVLDETAQPVGVLDARDVALEWPAGPLAPHHLPVGRLLRFRGRPRVLDSDTVATAAGALLEARTDALPVVNEDGRLTGLITARHCVELVAAPHRSAAGRRVGRPRQRTGGGRPSADAARASSHSQTAQAC